MSRTWMMAFALVLAPLVSAQESNNKIVEAKHLRDDRGTRAAAAVTTLIGEGRIVVSYEPLLNIFVLRGLAENVALAEKVIARLDQPLAMPAARDTSRQVTLNVHVVEGSPESASGGPIPASIESAVTQLRSAFPYKTYKLVDTVLLTTRVDARAGTAGFWQLPGTPEGQITNYTLHLERAVLDEPSGVLTVRDFRFNLRMPRQQAPFNFVDTGINTDLSIRPNQKLVLGKISSSAPQSSLFLIVTARVE